MINIKTVVVGRLETNCYIVENSNSCLIIDPGDNFNKIKEYIDKTVVGILVTHNHFDHIGALEECKDYYSVMKYDINNLNEGLNKVGDFSFEVKHNLGHTMDSISFIFDNIMFCGDFLFVGCIGRCDLGGDYLLMQDSIRNLLKSNINYKIYPGHGEVTYLDDERYMLSRYIK